jgi:primosomal protein N' (replication factor Y)
MVAAIEGQYSFAVPDQLADQVAPGKRLLVPFGRNRRDSPAFCVSVGHEKWTSTLKPVTEVLDRERLLNDKLLELGQWISRYYCCPLGRSLSAMVPEPIRKQSGFLNVRIYSPAEEKPPKLTARRQAILEALAESPQGLDQETLISRSGASKGILSAMVKAGLILMELRRQPAPAPDFDRPSDEPTFELNPDQQKAIQHIAKMTEKKEFRAALLYGVSGSGKTEVYIRAIRTVLGKGRQAILLVPEIALTTQIVDRLARRFQNVAVIHSGLTGVQRSLTYSAIARGEKNIVIGTRSAVFAPCPKLGLIVIDEAQETSFKNQQSPRFHTREVAVKRAQLEAIPVVLGSATPSLETWYNCERLEHFEKISLHHRIADLPMPEVEFVDMQLEQRQRRGLHLLSRRMEQCLEETLAAKGQSVLLLNRRGYASYLVCSRCRIPIVCPNCKVHMVFHQTTGKAMCHYCRARLIIPKYCSDPSCKGTLIRWGMGTQRVEEEVRTKFPQARLARADSDSMKHVEHYQQVVQGLQEGQLDVLIGTQMIAKGLDFPLVSFVGVVNSDTTMAVPDFRAAERTFHLVTQVAGRAGRAHAGGRVVVQSLTGLSLPLQLAANHDFETFAQHQLDDRQRLGWPPFSRLARIVVSHTSQSRARDQAQALADRVTEHIEEQSLPADILGPQSAPLARLRNQYRFDFLIRSPNAAKLMETIEQLRNQQILIPKAKQITIDVDPISLM